MRIAVTGALGHIGSRLIRTLPDNFPGIEIVLVDNLSTQRYCSLFDLPGSGRYEFVEADIVTSELRAIFNGVDSVIHLAAMTDPGESAHNRAAVDRVNLVGTERVARACIDTGASLLFASTTSVYGATLDAIAESHPDEALRPESPYAEAKLAAERLLREMSRNDGLRHIVCRLATICGTSPGMRFHTAVNKFCWQAVAGLPLTVWRTALHQRRPYLDLSDAVQAFAFLLRRNAFDSSIYNLATLNASVKQILSAIARHVPHIQVEYADSYLMNDLSFDVSTGRMQNIGFRFEGSVERCIGDTIGLLGPIARPHRQGQVAA